MGVAVAGALLRRTAASGGGDGDVSNAFHAIDAMCHVASLLETVAFMQHNMLALRALEMSSAVLLGTYSMLHSRNTADCHFLWAIAHFLVNAYHVALYLHRRFAISLSDEDRALHAGPLRGFSTAEFAEVKRRYRWETRLQSDDLLLPGREVTDLLLLTSGSVQVLGARGELVKSLDIARDGPQFIGEMAFFTREAPLFRVRVTSSQVRCAAWDMRQVRKLSHSHDHSLEASAFRQLPSLFARQLVKRVQNVSAKVADIQHAVSGLDDCAVHHVTGSRLLLSSMFKSGRVKTDAAKVLPPSQEITVDVKPDAALPGQSLANITSNDSQAWRGSVKWAAPDTTLAPPPATTTPTSELRSLAWVEGGSSPEKSGVNGASTIVTANVIGSQSHIGSRSHMLT